MDATIYFIRLFQSFLHIWYIGLIAVVFYLTPMIVAYLSYCETIFAADTVLNSNQLQSLIESHLLNMS